MSKKKEVTPVSFFPIVYFVLPSAVPEEKWGQSLKSLREKNEDDNNVTRKMFGLDCNFLINLRLQLKAAQMLS